MSNIYGLMIALIVVVIAAFVYVASENHAQDFVNEGQFDPKYIEYTDLQMLLECEDKGLFYSYEEGQCSMTEPTAD